MRWSKYSLLIVISNTRNEKGTNFRHRKRGFSMTLFFQCKVFGFQKISLRKSFTFRSLHLSHMVNWLSDQLKMFECLFYNNFPIEDSTGPSEI